MGTSNNKKDPVTVIGHIESRKVVFHIGNYQDTSDPGGVGARAGHYQSLEPVPQIKKFFAVKSQYWIIIQQKLKSNQKPASE